MEHENVDEAIRYKAACENVKKIVNAIKSLKIKYYLDFSKISEEDEKKYQQLEANLEKVSEENNLVGLKTELMSEVDAKYNKRDIGSNGPENPKFVDDKLMACYGVIDVEQKALSEGKLKKASKCQNILKDYLHEIDAESYNRSLVKNYRRKKFWELIMPMKAVHENNDQWNERMKNCCRLEFTQDREYAMGQVEEAKENTLTLFSRVEDSDIIKGVIENIPIENNTEEVEVG